MPGKAVVVVDANLLATSVVQLAAWVADVSRPIFFVYYLLELSLHVRKIPYTSLVLTYSCEAVLALGVLIPNKWAQKV